MAGRVRSKRISSLLALQVRELPTWEYVRLISSKTILLNHVDARSKYQNWTGWCSSASHQAQIVSGRIHQNWCILNCLCKSNTLAIGTAHPEGLKASDILGNQASLVGNVNARRRSFYLPIIQFPCSLNLYFLGVWPTSHTRTDWAKKARQEKVNFD